MSETATTPTLSPLEKIAMMAAPIYAFRKWIYVACSLTFLLPLILDADVQGYLLDNNGHLAYFGNNNLSGFDLMFPCYSQIDSRGCPYGEIRDLAHRSFDLHPAVRFVGTIVYEDRGSQNSRNRLRGVSRCGDSATSVHLLSHHHDRDTWTSGIHVSPRLP